MNRSRGRLPLPTSNNGVVQLSQEEWLRRAREATAEVSDAWDDDDRGPREGWLKPWIEAERRKRMVALLVWGITLLACAAALILTVFSR